jgi:hypothetical protein
MGKKQIEFNINQNVYVQLTPYGKEILRDRARFYDYPYIDKQETDGWSRWQLWDLLQTFGGCIYLGSPKIPFSTDIRIEVNDE